MFFSSIVSFVSRFRVGFCSVDVGSNDIVSILRGKAVIFHAMKFVTRLKVITKNQKILTNFSIMVQYHNLECVEKVLS
jgi:hypothetical protein